MPHCLPVARSARSVAYGRPTSLLGRSLSGVLTRPSRWRLTGSSPVRSAVLHSMVPPVVSLQLSGTSRSLCGFPVPVARFVSAVVTSTSLPRSKTADTQETLRLAAAGGPTWTRHRSHQRKHAARLPGNTHKTISDTPQNTPHTALAVAPGRGRTTHRCLDAGQHPTTGARRYGRTGARPRPQKQRPRYDHPPPSTASTGPTRKKGPNTVWSLTVWSPATLHARRYPHAPPPRL